MLYQRNQKRNFSIKKIGSWLAIYLGALFVTFALCGTSAWSADGVDRSTPDGLIKTITARVVKALQDDPSLQAGNMQGLNQLINQEILPYTDIEKTTRLAVGRRWREATADQRKELVEQFKILLIYTYAGALANSRNPEMEVLPFTLPAGSRDAAIKTKMMHQGQPIEVAYRLSKGQESWSLYDISVAGVWLVQNYRQQFQETLSGTGIPGLIASLKQQNKNLAGHV